MAFKDMKTYQNLIRAFACESEAYTKYNIFSDKARQDGFEQMADIFAQTALNELHHAEIWLRWLKGADQLPYTADNLIEAHSMDFQNGYLMYRQFSKTAKKEGCFALAALFDKIGEIERSHQERFSALSENMDRVKVFCKDVPLTWVCSVCGHETRAECSPEICPV
ncbi:MAG: ferritin family protein, partial [Oscillospiraceae bacterium]